MNKVSAFKSKLKILSALQSSREKTKYWKTGFFYVT